MVLALLVAAGCASSGPTRRAFSQDLRDRYGLHQGQADCVTRYLFAQFDDRILGRVQRSGFEALPTGLRTSFSVTLLACGLYGDPADQPRR